MMFRLPHVCFVFAVFFVLHSKSARVKHSEFKPSRQMMIPDDDEADWPSPDQIYFDLGESLDGEVLLPGGEGYRNGSYMLNFVFQSEFGAVVYPESTRDVQKTMLFLRDYGIRPTVYSSGHDFLGRSARDHTLSINMRRMRQMEVNMTDPRSDTNMTITLGTGLGWGELYEEVDKYGVIILGGSSQTVTPGGYILGGGHSPITRMKGLGVDQVVAFEMVTANGSIVYMTEEGGTMENPDGSTTEVTDTDVWWAVLGGGGGVYGVVTQFVLKLHQPPDGFVVYFTHFEIADSGSSCEGVATQALEMLLDILRTNLTSNWGGYIIPTNENKDQISRLGTLEIFMNHWGRDEQEAMTVLQDIVNFRPDCQDFSLVQVYDTFWEFQQNIIDISWGRQHLVGTILQEEDCVPGSGAAGMMIDVVNITGLEDQFTGCTGILIGGNAGNLPQDATSASPDFRNGLISLACYVGWLLESQDEEVLSKFLNYAHERFYQYGTGAYYNENDYYLQNWQVEYWGSVERYQRLLDVKQRWDPDNMFWCHHCVGSEFS